MTGSRKKLYLVIGIALLLCAGLVWFVLRTYFQRTVLLGAWTHGLVDPVTQEIHPEKLKDFETTIQKKLSIAHFYLGWESLADPKLITKLETLEDYGWQPMLNANPYYFKDCISKKPLYQAIAEGDCDTFLHNAGKNLSLVKKPFYFLFAWEMNNADLQWSVKYSASTTDDFVAAWRRIHTIFAEERATNVIWVFCPNTDDRTSVSYESVYPGDSYVDWTCIDGYNWGTTQSWSEWKSFADVFTTSYNHLLRIAPTKPIMIAEVNTTDQGGDKAAWYTDMFRTQIPFRFPKIQAVVIYNEDRSATEKVNWSVDISPQALEAFREGIKSGPY